MHCFYCTALSTSKDYSIQKQFEHLHAQLLRRTVSVKVKPTLLEALGDQEESRAIPEHPLDVVAAAIPKQVQTAAQRVVSQHVADDRNQTVKLLAHIDRISVRQDSLDVSREQHPSAPKASHGAIRELDLNDPAAYGRFHRGCQLDEFCGRRRRR
jgi:hypothetical protein